MEKRRYNYQEGCGNSEAVDTPLKKASTSALPDYPDDYSEYLIGQDEH